MKPVLCHQVILLLLLLCQKPKPKYCLSSDALRFRQLALLSLTHSLSSWRFWGKIRNSLGQGRFLWFSLSDVSHAKANCSEAIFFSTSDPLSVHPQSPPTRKWREGRADSNAQKIWYYLCRKAGRSHITCTLWRLQPFLSIAWGQSWGGGHRCCDLPLQCWAQLMLLILYDIW